MADGSVVIEITADASEFKKALNQISNTSFQGLGNALKEVSAALERVVKEMSAVANGDLGDAAQAADELESSAEEAANALEDAAEAAEEIGGETLEDAADSTDELSGAAEAAADGLKDVADTAGEAKDEVGGLGRESEETGAKLSDLFKGSFFGNLAVEAVKIVTNAVKDLGKAVYELGSAFESSFAQVETIMDTSQMSVEDMKGAIKGLSSEMGVSVSSLSGTVYNAISATGDTANAVSLVSDATKLATAGFTDTDSALSVLTTSMNAYHMSAEEAASISDSLIMTQNLGVTTIDALAHSMGKAIATASAYGVDLHNLESAYVSLTKAGISTEESTTYLSSMLKELGDSGSEVGKILKDKTGKSFGALMNEGKSLGDVLGILMEAADGDAEALMNLWGSAEAGKAANAIVSQGLKTFNDNLEKLGSSAGATEKAYGTMANTMEHKTRVLKNEVQNLAISLYERIQPALANLADRATEFVRNLDPDAVVTAVTRIAKALGAAVGAFTAFKTAMTIKKVASEVVSALSPVINAIGNLSLGTKKGQIAWKALSAAMSAAPIAAVAAGTLGVVGAMAALAIAFDDSKDGSRELSREIDTLSESIERQKQDQEDAASARSASLASVNAEISATERYISELQGLIDANGKVKAGYEDRASFLASQINSVLPGAISLTQDESGAYVELAGSIDQVIFAKKKEMALEAMRGEYTEAITGQVEANKKLTEATEKLAEAQRQFARANTTSLGDERSGMQINQLQQNLDKANAAYGEALQSALEYQSAINNFDTVSAAASVAELDAAILHLSDSFVAFNGSNAAEVESATASAIANYQQLISTAASSWGTMSETDRAKWAGLIQNAQSAMDEQIGALRETGAYIPAKLAEGAYTNIDLLPESVRGMVSQMRASLEMAGVEFESEGQMLDFLLANGILSNADEPASAAEEVAEEAAEAAEAAADGEPAGEALDASMAEGIESNAGEPAGAAEDAVQEAVSAGEAQAAEGEKIGASLMDKVTSSVQSKAGNASSAVSNATQNAVSAGESAASGAESIGAKLIDHISSKIKGTTGQVSAAAKEAVDQSVNDAKTASAKMSEVGTQKIANLVKGINQKKGDANSAAKGVVESAVSAANSATSGAHAVGANISAGIANGIRSGRRGVINAATEVARAAITAAKAALDEHSPSREFFEIGVMISLGLANGVLDSAHFAEEAVGVLAGTVKSAVNDLNKEIERIEADAAERQAKREQAEYERKLKEKYDALEKAEVKDRQKILDEIAKLEDDWNEKQIQKQDADRKKSLQKDIKALEDLGKAYKKSVSEVEKERDDYLRDLASQQEGIYNKLSDRDLFKRDQYSGKLKLLDLQPAIDEINRYEQVLNDLKERGLGEGLWSEILKMDTADAVEYGQQLLKMTDSQYDKYMGLWEEKEAASKRVSEQMFAQEAAIAQEAYRAVLDSLESEYVDQLPDEMRDAARESMGAFNAQLREGGEESVRIARDFADGVNAELARIGATDTLRLTVEAENGRVSAALAGTTKDSRETRQVGRTDDITALANALGMILAPAANPQRDVVLVINGKEFARATLDDYRSVEDQSPRIVSD